MAFPPEILLNTLIQKSFQDRSIEERKRREDEMARRQQQTQNAQNLRTGLSILANNPGMSAKAVFGALGLPSSQLPLGEEFAKQAKKSQEAMAQQEQTKALAEDIPGIQKRLGPQIAEGDLSGLLSELRTAERVTGQPGGGVIGERIVSGAGSEAEGLERKRRVKYDTRTLVNTATGEIRSFILPKHEKQYIRAIESGQWVEGTRFDESAALLKGLRNRSGNDNPTAAGEPDRDSFSIFGWKPFE